MSLLVVNIDGGQTDAGMSLMPYGALFPNSGVLRSTALLVSAQTSPGMSVKVSGSVANDIAIIKAADGSTYFVKNTDPNEPVTILSNSSGVTKTDAIAGYVELTDGDPDNAGSPGAFKLIAVRRAGVSTGTPTDGEIDAATNNNPWLKLATIAVINGETQVTSLKITDVRISAWFHTAFYGSNNVPGAALTDASLATAKYIDNSITAVKLATNAIELGLSEKTTTQGSITTEIDLSGLSVTVTVPAGGRDLLLIGKSAVSCTSTAIGNLAIKEGSTYLGSSQIWIGNTTNPFSVTSIARVSAPSAGSHTYKLALNVGAGTGTQFADSSAFKSYILALLI